MPSFYNGKRFFLTYPRCDKSPQELISFLQNKSTIKSYVVASERHKDDGLHLHACVEFNSIQRHGVEWLDFEGHHPNKQDPRNWAACRTYCKKDGNFIDGPEEIPEDEDPLEKCKNFQLEEDWMVYCISKKISFQYAQWLWNRCHGDDCTILSNECIGKICKPLLELKWNQSMKCLILRGPSGCGKTTWAKQNLPPPILFVSHVDTLKKFRPNFHKSIIFDDIDVKHYPRTAQIHIVDFENPRDIHCRHTTAHIPAGIHKCFTCNDWPLIEDPAISRRCNRKTVHLDCLATNQ